MKFMLNEQELEEHLTKEMVAPTEAQPLRDHTAYQKWNQKDRSARYTLLSSLQNDLIGQYDELPTCKALWDQLKFSFGGTSTTRLRSLVIKFEEYTKDPKHTISEHLRMMSNMIGKVRDAGHVLTDEQQVRAVIRSIPASWASMKHILTHSENIKNFSNVSQHVILKAETRDADRTLTYVAQEGSRNANDKRGRQSKKSKKGEASTSAPKEGKIKKRKGVRAIKPFGKAVREIQPLELVHSDMCGLMNVKVRHGASYFLTLIDNYTRYGYVYLISHRCEALNCSKRFVAEVENQKEKSLKTLRTDRGREYLSDHFKKFCYVMYGEHLNGGRTEIESRDVDFIESDFPSNGDATGNDMSSLAATKQWLSSTFEMKDMGEANYVFGVKIIRDRPKRLLGLSQETYIKKVIERFCMHNSKPIDTSMDKACTSTTDQCPKNDEEKNQMSKSNSGPTHWNVVKRILRYLRGTADLVLCYHGGDMRLRGYIDDDWGADRDERISTSGGAISWYNKKKSCIALSTMESEYVTCSAAVQEAV
ncbi:hypothetical protein RJ640_024046 [Escallonia rubra]|uniref:Integrase catalytic domain-containing protein n=1 Tax=Escallonia rubra TaxID=112253 RepID=A0AA88RV17_9ASTE|nr:hypothetical protein RJ640_024046 [Escallonia rubra]